MNIEKYPLKSGEKFEVFEFISEGPKGRITKIVQYSPTNYKGLYNLGFGDKNADTGFIDDFVISNNGDSEKVLATVVATLYAFTDKHTDALIYATGSTKYRTRLYRMGITKYIDEALSDFYIWGETQDDWEVFRKDIEYTGFFCATKKIIHMKLKDIKSKKTPIVVIDNSLDFFNDKILFPEKLEKANDMLRKIGLPKLKTT